MSTLQDNQVWSNISKENIDSKYEKCRNITEEIYKRINITFQIKKLETAGQSEVSEHSDQIDSNDLSNGTDLFACDTTDSLPSSEGPPPPAQDKYININNNEEPRSKPVSKRPRKRFRKRVKKRPPKPPESDGSSDEAVPLSRMVEVEPRSGRASPDNVGVPKIIIVTKDLKPKIITSERNSLKKTTSKSPQRDCSTKTEIPAVKDKIETETIDQGPETTDEKTNLEMKNCSKCSLSFRGERGLRRHMAVTHVISSEEP